MFTHDAVFALSHVSRPLFLVEEDEEVEEEEKVEEEKVGNVND